MLRPYQTKAIGMMRLSLSEGKKRLILCSPTGSGKTVMFTYMVARALEKGKQAIIFTDRVELLKQSNGALDLFGIKPTLIEASKTRLDVSGNCFIAMAQTFSRRKDATEYTDLLNRMDLVIIDEAHKQTFNPLLPYINPKAVVIGATATPLRRGNQECLSKFYEVLHVPVQVQELIDQGRITPDEAVNHPQRSLLTHALMGDSGFDPVVQLYPIKLGDQFLLCSDGLTGVLSDFEITKIIKKYVGQELVENLVAETRAKGAPDNVTVIWAEVVLEKDASSTSLIGAARA